jgi:hypothetical protein
MRWLMTLSSAIALASVISYVEMHADAAMAMEICCAVASIALFAIAILKFGRRGLWLAIPAIITIGATVAAFLVLGWTVESNLNSAALAMT